MPRFTQEILDHASELAKRFEDYEPRPPDRRSRHQRPTKGISWQRIGELLGTSAQAAQLRYGAFIEASG